MLLQHLRPKYILASFSYLHAMSHGPVLFWVSLHIVPGLTDDKYDVFYESRQKKGMYFSISLYISPSISHYTLIPNKAQN
jgi:hypothetical protein